MHGSPEKPDSNDCLELAQSSQPLRSLLRFTAGGAEWLNGPWTHGESDQGSRPRWSLWRSQPEYDLAEWTFRAGAARVTRIAFLLRGRQLALLAEQVNEPAARCSWELAVPPEVRTRSGAESRALSLSLPRGRVGPRVIPFGLPTANYATERGALEQAGSSLRLTQAATGVRTFLPLLLSWHASRDRREPNWRVLTVTRDRKVCKPGVAFAARVGWRGEPYQLVIYRSLAAPALRCFLGHQTSARFLIALFSPDGDLEPIVSIGADE